MKKYFNYAILILFLIIVVACQAPSKKELSANTWSISSYNFGQMEEFSIPEQIALLSKSGYSGLILKSESKKDFDNFEEYMRVTDSTDNFTIDAVFELYKNKYDAERREQWKLV